MIPELGQLALILALLLAGMQCVLPLIGAVTGNMTWVRVGRPTAYASGLFVLLGFIALTISFVQQDFSVVYVATNSNSLLPLHYRFTAVWGGHEGSLLLWTLVLSMWTVAVALFSRNLPEIFLGRVMAVMGLISIGFLSFMLFTSNPFQRHLPGLPEGNDLNPLLQDIGMIVHPPLLYMGYVGLAVAFAFAVAALMEGRMDSRWVKWSRPWTNLAWAFLTIGITLGSWWAYYELGWGGWWFWDPVENGSFMPWLAATALIHSQAVTEKRGAFKNWTILLSLSAFSLSLLGTFLVRSGVITSVHAFASDPERGIFILAFLGVISGGSLALFAIRSAKLNSGGTFTLASRETLLLSNNLIFSVTTVMVLLGTLFPLIAEAFNWGKVSLGPPYFGFMFFIMMIPAIALMPLGPFSHWKQDNARRWFDNSIWIMLLTLVGAAAIYAAMMSFSPELIVWTSDDFLGKAWQFLKPWLGMVGALWVMLMTLKWTIDYVRKARARNAPLSRGLLGMATAHFGVGVFLIGVTMVISSSTEKDIRMADGESFDVKGYLFTFVGTDRYQGPNYLADRGHFEITYDGDYVSSLYPEKRSYLSGGDIMTEAAVDAGAFRDLFVSLGEPLTDDRDVWSVRIYHKPFIRWIWLGGLIIMLGGILAATDRRYLSRRTEETSKTVPERAVT